MAIRISFCIRYRPCFLSPSLTTEPADDPEPVWHLFPSWLSSLPVPPSFSFLLVPYTKPSCSPYWSLLLLRSEQPPGAEIQAWSCHLLQESPFWKQVFVLHMLNSGSPSALSLVLKSRSQDRKHWLGGGHLWNCWMTAESDVMGDVRAPETLNVWVIFEHTLDY